jgi:competence protein ComEC
MFRFDNIPLIKILLFLAGGIFFAENVYEFFSINNLYFFLLLLISFALIVTFYSMRKQILFSFSVFIFLFLSGILLHRLYDDRNQNDHFSKLELNKNDFIQAKILSKTKTANGFRLKTKVNKILRNDSILFSSGNLLIFTDSSENVKKLNYGDQIIFSSKVSKIPKENNPHAFNPSQYFHYFNIHYQCYLKENRLIRIPDTGFTITKLFEKWNKQLQVQLRDIIHDKTNANLAISIILGDKQDLDKDLLSSFSSTGLTHVLTVSGMHVGIVALILNWIFSFLGNNKKTYKLLKVIFQLAGIWFYSFLAGNEPAILRAAFMITLILIGSNMKQNLNSLNLLFGSAIILLVSNPLQLFQLSFLLSYAAMLGLLIYYQHIYELINVENNKIVKFLWQLTALSISSQILLYPLLIFYFHNGPTLFILTALIATPMSFAALLLGFLGVGINIIVHDAGVFIGKVLSIIFDISTYLVDFLDSISLNVGDFIFFSKIDLILIYTIIILFTIFFWSGKNWIFRISLTLLLIFTFNQFYQIIKVHNENEIVIYNSKNNILTDIFIGRKCFSYSNNSLTEEQVKFTNRNYRLFKSSDQIIDLQKDAKFGRILIKNHNNIKINGNTILIADNKVELLPEKETIIDILVIGDLTSFDIVPVLYNYSVSQIIISNKTKYKNRFYIKREAEKFKIPLWDINEKGAFITKI